MHAFLTFCVLAEAAFIGLLAWKIRQLNLGAESHNERLDEIVTELERIDGEVVAIANTLAETAQSHTRAVTLHADLVRQVGIVNGDINGKLDAANSRLNSLGKIIIDLETKVSDVAEGTERMDADLSELVGDLKELARLCADQSKNVSERITEIADTQENIRRKAARPGAPNSAFESIRNIAETNSRRPDPKHDELVALAEG